MESLHLSAYVCVHHPNVCGVKLPLSTGSSPVTSRRLRQLLLILPLSQHRSKEVAVTENLYLMWGVQNG